MEKEFYFLARRRRLAFKVGERSVTFLGPTGEGRGVWGGMEGKGQVKRVHPQTRSNIQIPRKLSGRLISGRLP